MNRLVSVPVYQRHVRIGYWIGNSSVCSEA